MNLLDLKPLILGLVNQKNNSGNNNSIVIDGNNNKICPVTMSIGNQPGKSKPKHVINLSRMTITALLLFVILSSIGVVVLTAAYTRSTNEIGRLKKELEKKNTSISCNQMMTSNPTPTGKLSSDKTRHPEILLRELSPMFPRL